MSDTDKTLANTSRQVPKYLDLNAPTTIDISMFSEEERLALQRRVIEGHIDLGKQANEIKLNIASINNILNSANMHVEQATKQGHSATIQHTQTSSTGKTEIVVGNTRRAATGNLSGEQDNVFKYAVLIAIVIVVIAIMGK